MRRSHRLLAVAAALAALSAAAVGKGGKLYVTARDTRLQKDASPTAALVEKLQPGAEVIWQGADAANPRWHRVTHGAKSGVVFQANLSAHPQAPEVVASQSGSKPIDPQAFASSGAATKALSEAGLKYAEAKSIDPAVAKQVLVAEALAVQVAPADVVAHAKKAGVFCALAAEGGAK